MRDGCRRAPLAVDGYRMRRCTHSPRGRDDPKPTIAMLTLAPLEYAIRRSLGHRRTLEQMAFRTWELEPSSTQPVPKATYLEATMSRVTAPAPFSTLDSQREIIAGGTSIHRPIRAFSLRNVALLGSSLYVRGHRTPLAPEGGFRARDLVAATRRTRAVLGCTYFGNMFFGHFWTDDVPLMQLGSEIAQPVRTARPLTPHQVDLLRLIDLKPLLSSSALFDELVVLEDPAQTPSKEKRYRKIRETFARSFARPDPPRGVFLFRGTSGAARSLVNEEEVAEALRPLGVVPVRPEGMTLAELSRAIWGARLIVGVEGSQLLHGLYNAAEGASFLALVPPMRFGNIIKNYTDCLNMKYGFVVGEPNGGSTFSVPIDEVLRVIDLLERAPS
jgi:hypothetical protein